MWFPVDNLISLENTYFNSVNHYHDTNITYLKKKKKMIFVIVYFKCFFFFFLVFILLLLIFVVVVCFVVVMVVQGCILIIIRGGWGGGGVEGSLHVMNKRERDVLFNDALNTFYIRLYGVRHMVKDHSDSEKGNPLPPHRLLLSINRQDNTIPRPLLHQSWSTGRNEK